MDESQRQRSVERVDPWRASFDRLDELRQRIAEVEDLERDPVARRLMAEVELDRTTGFVMLLAADGVVLDVNLHALRAGGIDRSEAVGVFLWRTPWWRDNTRAQDEARRALETVVEQGGVARFDVEAWIEAAGTQRGTLDVSLRPLRGRDGMVELVLVDGRSVTDRKRAERRIIRQHAEVTVLNDRLALLVEHHRRLLGNLSHDLRMPMQLVLARADQILETTTDGAIRAEARAMRAAAAGALAQMESMLEQARRGDAEDQLDLSEGDLAATVRDVAHQFGPLAERHKIEIKLELPERLVAAFDPSGVSRIIANLVANALRFSPAGGVVRCSLTAHGSLAHLEVADAGPGIAEQERKQLFKRFKRGADERSQTGLGLAIVHDLVQLHQGTISVDTAPEGGALFIVTLPLDSSRPSGAVTLAQQIAGARQAELARGELETRLELALPMSTGPITALVVGELSATVEPIAAALEEPATFVTAGDLDAALNAVRERDPEIVFVGETAGRRSGATVVQKILADGNAGTTLVGVAEPGTAAWRKLDLAGAHVVLTLPELQRAGSELVDEARRRRALATVARRESGAVPTR
jgi:signal transduction histidine kinase